MQRRNRATAGTAAILGFGLALVWLALPRTVGHAAMARAEGVLATLGRGAEVPPGALLGAIAQHEAALRWLESAEGRNGLGALHLALARRPGLDPRERRALYERSIREFHRGLAAAPIRPFAWLQLAQARHGRDPGLPDALEGPMRLAYATGSLDPALVRQRVRIGFAAREGLSPGLSGRIAGDVRLWARQNAPQLAGWARPAYALPWVRSALAGDAPLDRHFVTHYLRLPAR